jgi:prolyl-tRNA synthetase
LPVRLEVGPRELPAGHVTLVRRDTADKTQMPLAAAVDFGIDLLEKTQCDLLARATAFRDAHITAAASFDEAVAAATTAGSARLPWTTVGDDGEQLLIQHAVTVRCLQRPDGSVPDGSDERNLIAYCARAY